MIEYLVNETGQNWPSMITDENEKNLDRFINEQNTIKKLRDETNSIVGVK